MHRITLETVLRAARSRGGTIQVNHYAGSLRSGYFVKFVRIAVKKGLLKEIGRENQGVRYYQLVEPATT